MKDKPILIIDSHAIIHSVKYGMIHLSFNEQSVGVVLGFLRKVYSLSKKFDTNKFVFTWDSKRRARQKLYPEYKLNHSVKAPELVELDKLVYPQIDDLRLYAIPKMGFKNTFIQSGLEADDLIAVVSQIPTKEHKIIVSGDGDLYQLLTPDISMYKVKVNKLYTLKDFQNDYNIEPNQWADVKKIAGCTSDHVKGVKGVGEKTAIKYLKGTLNPTSKTYQEILKSKDIIKRNDILVRLPFPTTKTLTLNWNENFRIVDFLKVTEKFGLASLQTSAVLERWEKIFTMK